MSDRAWMYTGHTGQNKWSAEWFTKTKGFVQAAFANGQRKTWCPCFRCGNWEKRTEAEMGKHLQKNGFTPDYTVWTFHGESAQRDRAEVDHRRTDEHGTGMENMVHAMMMLGIRTRRWRNLQRPSMKCWSLRNVGSTSTLSFVSWMPSHK